MQKVGIVTTIGKLAKTHDSSGVDKPSLTVVMLHGIASDSSTFDKALAYLEEQLKEIRFVTFDLLGSGKSPKGTQYTYTEQLTALEASLEDLKLDTPLVLVGHSMGTLIATRYAATHPGEIKELVLLSPPVYTEKDLDNPAMQIAIKAFRDAVSVKNPEIVEDLAFQYSMRRVVMDRDNYQTLAKLAVPATLIYGDADQIIAPFNLPKVARANEQITIVRTIGRHGVSSAKYEAMVPVLERILEEVKKERNNETL